MRIENTNLIWTLMAVFLSGVNCRWRVVYHQRHICAENGSLVIIPCSFYYPDHLSVQRVMWFPVRSGRFKRPLFFDSSSNHSSTRFQYIGDKKHNCSLKMDQVEPNDAGQFFFRFTTNSTDGKWTGKHGPTLKVVDLKIIVKQAEGIRATKEGDSVNLTCINAFDDRRPSCAFTWFKNGEPINQGAVLYLSNLSSKNSGNYACSLKGHPKKTSGVVNINVEHGPKNTSVSVRASMEGDFSRNVTLICSSHANPPVEDYTWFKVDDEDDDIMDVGPRPEFLPADGGQYFCGATNKHGSQNSSVVTVKIGTYWATFTRDVIIFAAVAVLLTVITVVALSSLYKKRIWIPKPDSEDDIQNTDYVNWLPHANHHPQEGPPCEGGTEDVTYSTVYFKKKTKSNMELPMDSRSRDDEGVIYICVSENSR